LQAIRKPPINLDADTKALAIDLFGRCPLSDVNVFRCIWLDLPVFSELVGWKALSLQLARLGWIPSKCCTAHAASATGHSCWLSPISPPIAGTGSNHEEYLAISAV
jgi:hypothetical protein